MKKFLLSLLFLGAACIGSQAQTRTFPYVNGPVTGGDCVEFDPTATTVDPIISDVGAPCGAGGGGSGNVSTTPGAGINQNIVQQIGTQTSTNNFNGIRYVTSALNWNQTLSVNLATPGAQVVTLTPCPLGLDMTNNSNQPYKVYIPTTNAEVAQVTGGSCTPGAASGTITFTTTLAHSASSNSVGSSTAGIQEGINDACGTGAGGNPNCHVVLPGTGANVNALNIYASIFVHCSRCLIEGYGTLLNCSTRDRCMFLGDLNSSADFGNVTVRGIRFETAVSQDGCLITSLARTSNVVTVTMAGGCAAIKLGDTVVIDFVDNVSNAYWGVHGPITGVTGTTVTYASTGANIASQTTPGTISIENAILEDNAFPSTMDQIIWSSGAGINKFAEGFVIDNDQKATISDMDNGGGGGLLCTVNHCGSYVYTAGNTSATPVIYIDHSNISPQCNGNGVTNYANNTVKINDTVIQGFGMWGVQGGTFLGSFGGLTMDNVYNEEGNGPCPNPYQGTTWGAAGVMFGSGGATLNMRGGEQPNGHMPQFANTGGTPYNYFLVIHDVTLGLVSYPLFLGYAFTNGAGTINGQFPHVPPAAPGDNIQYDVLRMVPSSLAANGPSSPVNGACLGGSTSACGSIITGQAQCVSLVCTFSDTAASNTTSYSIPPVNWFPLLNFWPGGLVVYGSNTTNVANTPSVYIDTDTGSTNASPWISVAGNLQPTFFVRQCTYPMAAFWGGAWTQCLESSSHGNSFDQVGALLLQEGGQNGAGAGLKGRLNFLVPHTGGVNPTEIITLVDRDPATTIATPSHRPNANPSDTWIGLDMPVGGSSLNVAQLAFGAPVSISDYIGVLPNALGTNFLERLTGASKIFQVPVVINSTGPSQITYGPGSYSALNGTYPCSGPNEGLVSAVNDSTTSTVGATITGGGSFHVLGFCNGTNLVAMSGTSSASGTVTSIVFSAPLSGGTVTTTGTVGITANGITATQLAAQYSKLRCEPGLGDGLNAIPSGTYSQFSCVNTSGVVWTITGISCWTDNAGTSTLNAANNAATGLLTGAVTCNNTKSGGGAAGTQSGTVTLANNDAITFTFVADGTSKQTTWTVSLTQ